MDSPAKTGGQLLLGVALVILIDQLCGLSSVIDRWDGGAPTGWLAIASVAAEHAATFAILAVVAGAGFLLTGRSIPPALTRLTIGGAVLSLGALYPMLEGYARLLQSTPIMNLSHFQLTLVRGGLFLVTFGVMFGLLARWFGRGNVPRNA